MADTVSHAVTVEWGDCDAAGIVFYPHYFRWFDATFQRLLDRHDLDQRKLQTRFGIVGTVLVDVGARFKGPASYGDRLSVKGAVAEWQTRSFTVRYDVVRNGSTIVEGHEKRVWAMPRAEGEGLSAEPIPPEFRQLLEG